MAPRAARPRAAVRKCAPKQVKAAEGGRAGAPSPMGGSPVGVKSWCEEEVSTSPRSGRNCRPARPSGSMCEADEFEEDEQGVMVVICVAMPRYCEQ